MNIPTTGMIAVAAVIAAPSLTFAQDDVMGQDIVVCAFEFRFLGGSMGSVVGEKFVRAVENCLEHRSPLVCFSASGGARPLRDSGPCYRTRTVASLLGEGAAMATTAPAIAVAVQNAGTK